MERVLFWTELERPDLQKLRMPPTKISRHYSPKGLASTHLRNRLKLFIRRINFKKWKIQQQLKRKRNKGSTYSWSRPPLYWAGIVNAAWNAVLPDFDNMFSVITIGQLSRFMHAESLSCRFRLEGRTGQGNVSAMPRFGKSSWTWTRKSRRPSKEMEGTLPQISRNHQAILVVYEASLIETLKKITSIVLKSIIHRGSSYLYWFRNGTRDIRIV